MMLTADLLAGVDSAVGDHLDSGDWLNGYLDAAGNRYFEESLFEVDQAEGGSGGAGAQAASFPLSETFNLHSNPGANHTIYLDFDGHVTSGTHWNSSFNNGEDIVTPAYSFEGSSSSFTDNELERIQRIWRWVSEDFLPFDVNVTTEDPGAAALTKSSGGDTQWGIRVVIGPNTFYSNAGGVAYLNSFNWNTDTPTFVFNNSELGVAEAASHEVGHTLGLRHDGQDPGDGAYYYGHGSGTTGWAPIMGVGYYENLTQWSRGEYPNANNTEDDLLYITAFNGFGYRNDDHGNSSALATPLLSTGGALSGEGIIERNNDLDVFSLTTGGGLISIDVDPANYHPNLDILAELYSATGTLVASSNPTGALNAQLTAAVAAGTYYLWVSGVGEGDPAGTGYSDYGSLGYYSISGSGASEEDSIAPTASLDADDITTPGASTHTFTVTYTDNLAVDVSQLDNNDLLVTGPGGFSENADFVSVDIASDGTPRVATYQIAAPGGSWDGSDRGVYTISLEANEVSDTSGNFAPAASLGTFTVDLMAPDQFEANDSFAAAADLGSSDRTENGLSIHTSGDDDYFKWTAAADGTLTVDVLFQHSAGDIDVVLYDANFTELNKSISVTDNEWVTATVSAGETYYLHVYGYDGATNPEYDLVIDGPVALLQTVGETGTVTFSQANSSSWLTVQLDNSYVNPVVIAQPPSFNGPDPATIRIRNVTSNSFEVQIDEWDYRDAVHTVETIGYMVVEAGTHTLGDGTTLQAGTLNLDQNWATATFADSFDTTPVVLSQSQTYNGSQAITTRQRNATAGGFDVRLQEEEGNDGWHLVESVGFVAIETGAGSFHEAGLTGNEVTNAWHSLAFDASHQSPILLAGMQTVDGPDPASLRYRNLTGGGTEIKVEEEQSRDTEMAHTTEVVGYVVFGSAGTFTGQSESSGPEPSSWLAAPVRGAQVPKRFESASLPELVNSHFSALSLALLSQTENTAATIQHQSDGTLPDRGVRTELVSHRMAPFSTVELRASNGNESPNGRLWDAALIREYPGMASGLEESPFDFEQLDALFGELGRME